MLLLLSVQYFSDVLSSSLAVDSVGNKVIDSVMYKPVITGDVSNEQHNSPTPLRLSAFPQPASTTCTLLWTGGESTDVVTIRSKSKKPQPSVTNAVQRAFLIDEKSNVGRKNGWFGRREKPHCTPSTIPVTF